MVTRPVFCMISRLDNLKRKMSKQSNRSNLSKVSMKFNEVSENDEIKNGNAKFGFQNGDVYEGEFLILNGKNIFKQGLLKLINCKLHIGLGVYVTDNFDIYTAKWDRDNISTDLHIQYNNRMEYKGGINVDGEMVDFGTYIFPDASSIEGTWSKNKPLINFNFVEPSGFKWKGFNSDIGKEIVFTPGNHFWKDFCGAALNEDENGLKEDIVNQKNNSKISLKSKKRSTSKKLR